MLNFDNLDGFVVDLDNTDDIYDRLKDCLEYDEELYHDIINHYSFQEKVNYLIEHYISTYKYVFMLSPTTIFVCTTDLTTKTEKSHLKLPPWVIE